MGAECRRLEQYADGMLAYMLAVGSAPGAGNRSHISDVLSAVGKEIHQVNTERNFALSVSKDVICLRVYPTRWIGCA